MSARESFERAALLAALVARHTDIGAGLVASKVCHLQRIARQEKAINQRQENGYPDTDCGRAVKWRDKDREESLGKKAANICADFGPGFAVELGGDPRGPCAWLTIPGEPGEGFSYDGKSYAIY